MQSKYNYYMKSKNNRPYTNNFSNSIKNNIPTTVTEIVESKEQNTLPISSIMPNIKEFYISFSNNSKSPINNNNNNELIDENKLKIRKKDLYKVFNMIKISKDSISPYILFSFTSVHSEIVSNPIKAYKIDYKKLIKLIQSFYIQFGNEDENQNIEINKNSLMKIFDLLGLSPNKRLSLIQFFEVDEEIEYEEEEDEEDGDLLNLPLSRTKKIKMNQINENKENNNFYNPNTTFEIEKRTKTTTTTYPDNIKDKEKLNYKIKNNKIIKENIFKSYTIDNENDIKKEKIIKKIRNENNEFNNEIKEEEKNKMHLHSKNI